MRISEKRFGEEERRFVLTHNHPDVVAEKYVKFYEEILS